MSLPILVALVVGGISLIVLAIHLTGGTRNAALQTAAEAVARFTADFPEEIVSRAVIAGDGLSAFLELTGGRTGIVQSVGDRFLTRIEAPGDVVVEKTAGSGLRLRTHEFSWAGGIYDFDSAVTRDEIARRLSGREA